MKRFLMFAIPIVIICVISFFICISEIKNRSYNIPEGYIAEFHGGYGEVTYTTFVYKVNNDNYKYEYISVENTTISYGNPQSKIKLIEKGYVETSEDVFIAAKKNNAYSYVKLPNDNSKIYTTDEYKEMIDKK